MLIICMLGNVSKITSKSLLHSDLPFLPERMEINKCKKLVCNLSNKKKIHHTHKFIKTSIKSWIKVKKDL